MSYYKFRPISKFLIESLTISSIYFSKPGALNDPFDCRLNNGALFGNKLFSSDSRLASVKKNFENNDYFETPSTQPGFSDHGIFSVSKLSITNKEEGHETLMWSHYADEHKGVRLKYNLDQHILNAQPPAFTIDTDVFYDDENFLNFMINLEETGKNFHDEFCYRYLTIKHPAWKYEQEVRFVRPLFGPVTINPACLEEICFGLNTSEDDKKRIIKLAYTHCGCTNFKKKVRGPGWLDFTDEQIFYTDYR